MPPNVECPNCHFEVQDWHVEWYKSEHALLYRGNASMDCPLCGQPVGLVQGNIGPPPPGVPMVRRHADKAAEWAAFQAKHAGGTLYGYLTTLGSGLQYSGYWPDQEIMKADADEKAKSGGP